MKELVCGGVAGAAVDAVLFPLDTIKTRLQSKEGFRRSGGYSRIYLGLSACLSGSVPSSALFFATYTLSKGLILQSSPDWLVHLIAASLGEAVACLARVPAETIKQRLQAQQTRSAARAVAKVLHGEGIAGLYRAYPATLSREIPFSCIQFPLYECFKKLAASRYAAGNDPQHPPPWIVALCGLAAGGIAAAATTPLDVIKTRIMLARTLPRGTGHPEPAGVIATLRQIFHDCNGRTGKTLSVLFSGIMPRVIWISAGGYIFFGSYESTHAILHLLLS